MAPPEPLPTSFCRDCGYHCYSPERLAEHAGHALAPSGRLYRLLLPSIDPRRLVGLWVHEEASYLVRHDCALDDAYLLDSLFNDPVYNPGQKNELMQWVGELDLPL